MDAIRFYGNDLIFYEEKRIQQDKSDVLFQCIRSSVGYIKRFTTNIVPSWLPAGTDQQPTKINAADPLEPADQVSIHSHIRSNFNSIRASVRSDTIWKN